MCDGGYTLCGRTRLTSIPSQRVCVVDRENLRHLASARLTCMLSWQDKVTNADILSRAVAGNMSRRSATMTSDPSHT